MAQCVKTRWQLLVIEIFNSKLIIGFIKKSIRTSVCGKEIEAVGKLGCEERYTVLLSRISRDAYMFQPALKCLCDMFLS